MRFYDFSSCANTKVWARTDVRERKGTETKFFERSYAILSYRIRAFTKTKETHGKTKNKTTEKG